MMYIEELTKMNFYLLNCIDFKSLEKYIYLYYWIINWTLNKGSSYLDTTYIIYDNNMINY